MLVNNSVFGGTSNDPWHLQCILQWKRKRSKNGRNMDALKTYVSVMQWQQVWRDRCQLWIAAHKQVVLMCSQICDCRFWTSAVWQATGTTCSKIEPMMVSFELDKLLKIDWCCCIGTLISSSLYQHNSWLWLGENSLANSTPLRSNCKVINLVQTWYKLGTYTPL